MAVAAADFYTYARATGTPLPKTKQEEAQLTPAVDKWKKSRTKAPERQEDSNAIRNILGTGAVAAGLAGAAAYGYRRGWGDTPGRPVDGPTPKGSPSPSSSGRDLPSDIPARLYKDDQRGVQVGKQGNLYRTQPVDIKEQPQVKTEFQNQAAADRDWDLAYIKGREDGLSDADAVLNAKRTVNQPIRKDYSPGPETEHRQHLSTLKTSSPISPRSYIEKTGAIEPDGYWKTKAGKEELLEQAADTAYANSDEGKFNYQKELELDSRGIAYDHRKEIELWKDNWKADHEIDDITSQIVPRRSAFTKKITEQDYVDAALAKVKGDAYADELTRQELDSLRGIDRVVKDIRQEDTLVAQQKTIGPELTEQTLESANSGYEQMDDAFDRSVQRDTDSIAVGSQAVELEKTQQGLLEDAKLKAAAAIENRRIQLEQNTNLDPRSTRFDNALAREWATKPNVDPSIDSEEFRKTVQAPKEVEDFISTEIPETDASNVARNYYNEDTGNIQFATEDGGSPLIRDIYKEKVLPSEDVSKAASGGTIRGQSRSLDIQEPQRRTRTDEFTGDISPDTPGGLTGFPKGPRPRGVQLSNEASPALPLNQRAPRTQVQSLLEGEVERIDDYANQGGGAGMGVYGREQGYVAGPNSKTVTGLRSTGLRAKPTDVPETRKGREFNPQTKRDEFRDLSNDALRNIISRGTYRNNKQGRTAREAQYELKLRKDLAGKEWEGNAENYAPNTAKAKKSMEISRDIQNIYNSGRPDAQEQVQAYIQGLRQGQQF